jgi:hypothetical protein
MKRMVKGKTPISPGKFDETEHLEILIKDYIVENFPNLLQQIFKTENIQIHIYKPNILL